MSDSTARRKLAVVVPTYKRTTSLGRLLASLREQSDPADEVLIVDQNEPGFLNSQLGADELASVRIIRQSEPNCSAARNFGFAQTVSSLVAFLDDDLEPGDSFFARVRSRFEQLSDVGCLLPVVHGPEQDPLTEVQTVHRQKRGVHPSAPEVWKIHGTMSAAMIFQRTLFEETGGFDEHLFRFAQATEDHELFHRMENRKQPVWMDTSLHMLHHHDTPGGAALRSIHRRENRKRCIRGWTFKAWAHSGSIRRLRMQQVFYLLRQSVLNRRAIMMPREVLFHELGIWWNALRQSRWALADVLADYGEVEGVDHLQRYGEKRSV